jgi:hypothetical protein
MTERQKKLDHITDSIYYYMVELISCADDLEDIGFKKEGESLRHVADQVERIGIRLLNHKYPKRRA